jgi:hypothetical protein
MAERMIDAVEWNSADVQSERGVTPLVELYLHQIDAS